MTEENKRLEERVDKHESEITELKIKMTRNDTLTEQCLNVIKDLNGSIKEQNETMNDVRTTMIALTSKVNSSDDNIKVLTEKVDNLENKGLIDWQLWVKKNIGKIIMFIILLCLAFPQVAQIFKQVFL